MTESGSLLPPDTNRKDKGLFRCTKSLWPEVGGWPASPPVTSNCYPLQTVTPPFFRLLPPSVTIHCNSLKTA